MMPHGACSRASTPKMGYEFLQARTDLEAYTLITLSDLLVFDTSTEVLSFPSGGCVSCTCTTFMQRAGVLCLASEAAKTRTATYKSSTRRLRPRDSFQPRFQRVGFERDRGNESQTDDNSRDGQLPRGPFQVLSLVTQLQEILRAKRLHTLHHNLV
jgi:hypothetical protein